ncbi:MULTISPECIES: polysaccharide biosynthesis protein [Dyella]|uniref:Polysaccharide biosynthesis protein n=2 Tax=Dyella TaxID=231454 RepID=A0A4R0YJT4_9GAMM|nr:MULTISPECIES: polysaccharide biosynthesis protein [Dyella]TBR36141.1 polysaccharide biosynthesis protein [Dyella terrae]TCI06190.1 polysaccharide biosynthesis protein [Dyella soli]
MNSNDASNDRSLPESIESVLEAAARNLEKRPTAGHSIARMQENVGLLAPRQLEERRLIHRDASVRPHSDAFREIRTRLLGLGGTQNFVTLVVSVSPRSGCSFVARNLAAAFAFDEAKTSLLIDCNLRYPNQHRALGVDPTAGGLVDLLEHPVLGMERIVYHTGIPHLRLIPAGRVHENSGEYFSSFRMSAVLDQLRTRYTDRYLFLDGPAIKGSPDARILSDLADFVVVVAGYGRDTPAAISQAVTHFDPAKMAGVVFNHVP